MDTSHLQVNGHDKKEDCTNKSILHKSTMERNFIQTHDKILIEEVTNFESHKNRGLRALKSAQHPQTTFVLNHLQRFAPFMSPSVLHQWNQLRANTTIMTKDLPVREPLQDLTITLEKQPSYIVGGEIRSYQLEGLNWLISRHDHAISGKSLTSFFFFLSFCLFLLSLVYVCVYHVYFVMYFEYGKSKKKRLTWR